jgi:hypothetical protein
VASDFYVIPIHVLNGSMFTIENASGSLDHPVYLLYDFEMGHYDSLEMVPEAIGEPVAGPSKMEET